MLTQLEERTVSTHGVKQTGEFRIKANAKAFKVLIDGLYSDKIRAVIRELWTNAYDSHIMAGKADEPFQCRLPTIFEPEFAVRDFGISLDHDDVMNLYTTVFESTKEDTNDQVGKLGLGSKSPFAYTDTFTVTAWMNGRRRVYSAYIGGDHIPRISLLDDDYSDEPQGLEISFPVESGDSRDFARKAGLVSRGFEVEPTIVGGDGDLYSDNRNIEIVTQGEGWQMYTNPDRYSSAQAYAKQGCVLYPINADYIKNVDEPTRMILEANIIIDFPVGQVDIAANREALSYDDVTVANIVDRVKEIHDDLTEEYSTMFDDCKTPWEASLKYGEVLSDRITKDLVKRIIGHSLKFKGEKVSSRIALDMKTRDRMRSRTMHVTPNQARRGLTHRSKNEWNGKWVAESIHTVFPSDDVFYVDIVPAGGSNRGAGAKIAHAIRQRQDDKRCIWVKVTEGSSDFARYMVACGRPNADAIIMVSDLPDAPKSVTQRSARTAVKCKQFSYNNENSGHWEHETEIDTNDTNVLYVEMNRNKAVSDIPSYGFTDRAYAQAIAFMKKQGVIDHDTKIVQVPATHRKKIERAGDNWREFFSTAKNALQALLTVDLIVAHHAKENVESSKISPFIKAMESTDFRPAMKTPVYYAAARYRTLCRYLKRQGSITNLFQLADKLNVSTVFPGEEIAAAKTGKIFPNTEMAFVEAYLRKTYPMMQYVTNGRYYSMDDDELINVIGYMDLVDKAD